MDNNHDGQTTSGKQPHTTGTVDHVFQPGDSVAADVPPAVGDRYHVTSLHRSGGLGRIWVVRDEALGRDVALKDLRPNRAADPRLRARFVEEARITGQLEHPYIVPLYDLIDGPEGPCYTMRFVAGRTMAEAARDYHERRTAGRAAPLDLAGLLDAFVAVCRAVSYAHNRGVLHRDLKGQNVVLGDYGEVFVLDWGLAKLAASIGTSPSAPPGEAADASPAVVTPSPVGSRDETISGAILGTPAFLAPEQAAGGPASTATDVYGLGGVLYVILTGKPPYDGPTMQEVLDRILEGPPPRPRILNPACPPALEAICRRAMAREPAARYSSAEAVAADVRRWLADEPVEAYREPWLGRAARWARRHRPAVIGAAAVLLTAVIGLAVSTALVWREERRTAEQRAVAEREWARAEDNLDRAHGLTLKLLDISDKQMPNIRQNEEARKAMTAAALDSFRQSLAQRPDDPQLRRQTAQAHRYAANLHRLLNEIAAAEPQYRESIRILETLIAEFPDDAALRDQLAQSLRDQGQLLNRLGRIGDASAAGRRAAKLAEELGAADPGRADYRRTLAFGLVDLSGYEYSACRFSASEETARRATDLLRGLIDEPGNSSLQENRLFLVMALHRRAIALGEMNRTDDSLAASADALAQVQLLPAGDNNAQHYQGRILVEQAKILLKIPDRRPGAEQDVGQAIQLWGGLQKAVPRAAVYREWQAGAYEVRGRIRAAVGQPDQAIEDLEKARTMLEKLVADFPELPGYHSLLGQTYLTLGRLESARGNAPRAADWLAKAGAAYRAAIDRSPENAIDRRDLSDVEAELKKVSTGGQ